MITFASLTIGDPQKPQTASNVVQAHLRSHCRLEANPLVAHNSFIGHFVYHGLTSKCLLVIFDQQYSRNLQKTPSSIIRLNTRTDPDYEMILWNHRYSSEYRHSLNYSFVPGGNSKRTGFYVTYTYSIAMLYKMAVS